MFHFFGNNSSLELEAGKFSTSKMHSRNQPEIWAPQFQHLTLVPISLPRRKKYLHICLCEWEEDFFADILSSILIIYVGGASSSLLEVYLVCAHYESNIQCPAQPLAFSKKDDWKLDPIHIVFFYSKGLFDSQNQGQNKLNMQLT